MSNNKNINDMKTYYSLTKNAILKSVVGLLGITAVSCGSYQNVSYYDNDGIYGSDKREVVVNETQKTSENSSSNKYKEYFGSNADRYSVDNQETFTDIESYSSATDSTSRVTQNYAGWGSNDRDITINVYDNSWGWNNWGWRNYWGYRPYYCGYSYWNNWYNPYWGYAGWYGPSWGWGWNSPYYGGYYGWNNWGWNNWYGNGYYGSYFGRDYAYANGRRSTIYTDGNRYSNRVNTFERRYDSNRRNSSYNGINSETRNFGTSPRRRTEAVNSSDNSFNTPRTRSRSESPRTQDTPRSSSPRTYEAPRRSESPRSYDAPRTRSYESPRSSGGGSYGGGTRGGRRG